MQSLKIILLSIGAAVGYGLIHDQVTVRICLEYFTVAHPPVFGTENPTLLGLGWGVIATWWVGFLMGTPLAVAARLGPWPKRSARSLVKPLAWLMLTSAICVLVAGVSGWALTATNIIQIPEMWATTIPEAHHARFMADAFSHFASYAAGFLGGLVLIGLVAYYRFRQTFPISSR